MCSFKMQYQLRLFLPKVGQIYSFIFFCYFHISKDKLKYNSRAKARGLNGLMVNRAREINLLK